MKGDPDTLGFRRWLGLVFLIGAIIPASAQTTFTKKQFGTALDPFCVAWGDFNGDGDAKLDLATASFSEHAVAVQFNDGAGNFSVPSKFATGNSPQCIYQADVNRDNRPDLVVTGTGPDSVSVLLGTGTGAFSTPKVTPIAMQSQDLALADWDGDLQVDLASVDSTSNKVTLLRGNGDGTFAVSTFAVTGATQLRSIASADFNIDGKVDLAVLDCCAGTETDPVSKIYTLTGNGNLGFTSKVGITARAIGAKILSGWDIDRNGSTDILMSYANSVSWANKNGVAFLAGANNGYFSVAKTYGIDSGFDTPVNKPLVGDLDGQGRIDIILAGSKNANPPSDFVDPTAYFHIWYLNSDGSLRSKSNLLVSDPGYPTGSAAFFANGDHLSDPIDLAMVARTGGTTQLFALINNRGASTTCSAPSSSTGLHVCSPTNGSTVSNPVRVTAKGGSAITTLEAWIDGTKRGQASGTSLSFSITLSAGRHRLTVFARSNGTKTATQIVNFTVK
jgi:hypothetical protein